MSKYMDPIKAVSINFSDEPLLTIHCDGRVTTSDRLKPTETAVLALNQIKTQWMKDSQATKIRELQDQIERLEDWKESALAVEREWNANAIATMLGGKLGESQREVIQREVPKLLARIKRLEEALNDIAKEVPAHDGGGGFFWPMFDGEGNEIGVQQVDPLTVIGAMHTRAIDALRGEEAKEAKP